MHAILWGQNLPEPKSKSPRSKQSQSGKKKWRGTKSKFAICFFGSERAPQALIVAQSFSGRAKFGSMHSKSKNEFVFHAGGISNLWSE